ncbi:MAG: phosphoribosyl-AMP cyclohydrolase [Clostridia bacterium]|nr:phosphoribosyl-AMP cyclohydrolase [Clostridia bacterium]
MIDLSKLWQMRDIMSVVTVDSMSGKVLMLGYMNKEAFAYTLKTRKAWYCNSDGSGLRMKGEHSGNVQKLVSITADYDYRNLLVTVDQIGKACPYDGGHSTYFIHNIFGHDENDISKRKKFGRVEIDKNFDFSKEDYDD